MKRNLVSIFITLLIGFIIYYFALPAINIHSFGFCVYLILLLSIYTITLLCSSIDEKGRIIRSVKILIGSGVTIIVIILGIILIDFIMSPLFHSKVILKESVLMKQKNLQKI